MLGVEKLCMQDLPHSSLKLPHVGILVGLVSGWQQEFCLFVEVFNTVVTDGHLPIKYSIFSKLSVQCRKCFSLWTLTVRKMLLIHTTCFIFSAIYSAKHQMHVGHFSIIILSLFTNLTLWTGHTKWC
jgi:hypothetical protein